MREVLGEVLTWWEAGRSVGLATVLDTTGGAPRPIGATMAVGPDGAAVGGVSGGCVEASVYDLSREVAADGVAVLEQFQSAPDNVFAVGRPCGGTIDVFVERVDRASYPELAEVAAAIRSHRPVAVVTVVRSAVAEEIGRRLVVWPDRHSGTLGGPGPDARAVALAGRAMTEGRCSLVPLGGGTEVFVAGYRPLPRLLVFGSSHGAAAVAGIGAFIGYRVTVCDNRATFATTARFPDADDLVLDRPDRYLADEAAAGRIDERTVICVLTHDPKFDVSVLAVALRLPVAYVGVMGSRRAQQDLNGRLVEAGVGAVELAGLAAPIGLDLHGKDSAETAVSIAAEIIAVVRGGTGTRLSTLAGPIHAAPVG